MSRLIDDKKRLEEAIKDAQFMFWASIVQSYPESEGGDLDIGMTIYFDQVCREAVEDWLWWNDPKYKEKSA